MKRFAFFALVVFAAAELSAGIVQVRNVARPAGQRENQLSGIGLVVGLGGTGDTRQTLFTQQALANLLSNMGLNSEDSIKTRNVAAVLVTAQLPAFAQPGKIR